MTMEAGMGVGGQVSAGFDAEYLAVFLPQATEFAKEEVKRVLGVLDSHLRTQTFLVGERVSLADITVVCALLWLYKQVGRGTGGWWGAVPGFGGGLFAD